MWLFLFTSIILFLNVFICLLLIPSSPYHQDKALKDRKKNWEILGIFQCRKKIFLSLYNTCLYSKNLKIVTFQCYIYERSPPCGSFCIVSLWSMLSQGLTCCVIGSVEVHREVQTFCLFLQNFNMFRVYLSCSCWKMKWGQWKKNM